MQESLAWIAQNEKERLNVTETTEKALPAAPPIMAPQTPIDSELLLTDQYGRLVSHRF